jgi:iron(III) transport system ATP-binding protein
MADVSLSRSISNLPPGGKAGPVFAGRVQTQGVGYAVRGKPILNSVSMEVEAGQIACLLGPSGCGKTTLLRLLAGILVPSAGRILLDGVEVAGPGKFVPPERRNIGLVFQDFALFPHMTALENVAYGLYALSRKEALGVAGLALERVALSHAAHRLPASLSGGEQQRVALARALVPRPQVVLLDEPFSGLDQRLKESVRTDTLSLLREIRATALLVTHDPDEALAFADHIHVMQHGDIAQSGKPEDLLNRPLSRAVAQFFRSYNVFTARVHAGVVQTPLGAVAADRHEGKTVDVMVAPHGLRVVPAGQGVAADVLENRDLGMTRRLLLRLANVADPVLVMGPFAATGRVGLVLTGADTHIFEARP